MNNIYKWVWSHTTGRPFTYVLRDVYHKVEFIALVSLVFTGFGLSYILDWDWMLIIMAAYSVGFIHGHIFWGTDYLDNQGGNQ